MYLEPQGWGLGLCFRFAVVVVLEGYKVSNFYLFIGF